MRIRTFAVWMALATGLAPALAGAGTLASATWTQDIRGIAFTVTNAGATCTDTDPAHIPGAGSITCPTAGLQATGTSTGTSYNVSLTMPLFAVQVFSTSGSVVLGTRATLSGVQSIVGNAVSATGSPGIAGIFTVGFAQHTQASGWSQVGPTILRIPLGVGQAGSFTTTFAVGGSIHYMTVDFYAWTPGTLTLTGVTSMGEPRPDLIVMGSFDLTPNGAGTVTLVSPSKITIDGPYGVYASPNVRFATLTLTFVPEPATLLLLGAGALGLLRFGRWSSAGSPPGK